MQTPTQSQPSATTTQAPAPTVSIRTPGPDGTTQTLTIPTTVSEVEGLLVQREELASQLSNVTARRDNLSSSIPGTPEGASRAGLETRIQLLDQRILQIEGDLDVVGRKLASAPAELAASSESPQGGGDLWAEGMAAGAFGTSAFFAIALLYARRRRKRRKGTPSVAAPAESARLERVEQGIEAIAIEIERVSEGQRFVTRLLSESQTPLGASHRIPQPLATEQEGAFKR